MSDSAGGRLTLQCSEREALFEGPRLMTSTCDLTARGRRHEKFAGS